MSTFKYNQQQYQKELNRTTTMNSEKNNNINQIKNEQDNGTEKNYVQRFDKGKWDKSEQISTYLTSTVLEIRSITENQKINNDTNRPDERKNVKKNTICKKKK